MIHLKGHNALITGSSKGVGKSIAEAFAKAGANVVIHSRGEADDTVKTCASFGVKADFVAADLLQETSQVVNKLYNESIVRNPDIDILVNNAGQFFDCDYLEMTEELFNKTIRLNVAVPYFLTQKFAQYWIERKIKGRVLMIGSINGRLAEHGSTAYDTSKGALEMMVKTLAVALAPKGIRINGMAPGLVRTPQTSWLDQNPARAKWNEYHTPNGSIPHSDVCGAASVYLVSDAAEHVHGQMLLVDGGMSIWQHPSEPLKI